MSTSLALAGYCLVSATMQFCLGFAWANDNAIHRAIKFAFLFASVWGAFFGACLIKGYITQ